MSHVTITGIVAAEPKPFTFPDSGKTKTELRIKDGNVHHTVILWSAVTDIAEGDAVLCEDGRIGYRSWDKDVKGETIKVWQTEFTCQRITKLGSIAAAPAVVPLPEGLAGDLDWD